MLAIKTGKRSYLVASMAFSIWLAISEGSAFAGKVGVNPVLDNEKCRFTQELIDRFEGETTEESDQKARKFETLREYLISIDVDIISPLNTSALVVRPYRVAVVIHKDGSLVVRCG